MRYKTSGFADSSSKNVHMILAQSKNISYFGCIMALIAGAEFLFATDKILWGIFQSKHLGLDDVHMVSACLLLWYI